MRIRSLSLVAFGPFSGQTLDFSAGSPGGLHLVYGRNEAGKSTALRAVSGLLFGIPERTPDAHLHPAPEVRVAGVIEGSGARVLEVIRRKKRKDSLRDAKDAPLDEALLSRLLGGVNRELFQHLFGLDHQALRVGGEALLAGKGDVGQSLYDAGVGGRGIHAVLVELEREQAELFKARGQNPKLNAALEAYKEALRRKRGAALVPSVFFEQRRALEEQRLKRTELEAERRRLLAERDRKLRIAKVVRPAASRRELLAERAALCEVPSLPAGARERRESAERRLRESSRRIAALEPSIARQVQRATELPVDERLLAMDAALIERLGEQLGLVRRIEWDLPVLRAAIAASESEAVLILQHLDRGLSLERAEALRLRLADEERIRELERERALIVERSEAARRQAHAARNAQLSKISALSGLPEPLDTSKLRHALGRARKHAALEERLAELGVERAKAAAEAASARRSLNVEDDAILLGARVPSLELLERFDSDLRELEQARLRAAAEHAAQKKRVSELQRQISRIERGSELPSVAALRALRERRDQGFELIRRQLKGDALGEELLDFDPSRPLDVAFEQTVRAADEMADALWREAARVSEITALRAQLEEAEAAVEHGGHALREADAALESMERRWQGAWSVANVAPCAPAEMRDWVRGYGALAAAIEQGRHLDVELAARRAELDALSRELAELLECSEPCALGALVERAEARLEEQANLASERRLLKAQCTEHEARVREAETELAERTAELELWQRAWNLATASLGLGENPSPAQVIAVLDERRALFQKLDQLPDKRRAVSEREAERQAFLAEIADLVERFAPELAGLPPLRQAEELLRAATASHGNARQRQSLTAERAELERELDEQRRAQASAEAELAELLSAAGVQKPSELEALEQQSEQRQALDAQVQAIEQQIRELGDGQTLDQLLSECQGVERDAALRDKQELESRLEEIDGVLGDTIGNIRALEDGLYRLQTGEEAAEAAQEAENLASEVRGLVERYVRVRLASAILSREIGRYRDRHQGPILSRAAALFERLTLGRYATLRAGLEEQSIACVRRDGTEVEVSGLSEGAQYQLFLALRLATIDHYLAANEAMPLVLDDVLLHFDDERARAAFAVFGELAQRVQILFFTHHSRHVELAREALGEGGLVVHELGAQEPGRSSGALRLSLGDQ